MNRTSILAALTAAILCASAIGQEVRQYREGDAVDPRDVARMLGTPEAKAPIIYRSIRMIDQPAAQANSVREDAPSPQPSAAAPNLAPTKVATTGSLPSMSAHEPRVFALPVQFAFDSASILHEARAQLDAVAEGIKLLPPGRSVVIEGHTDAAGADQYNRQLSTRRAMAVKQYLVAIRGIEQSRLTIRGLGESQPINAQDPYAGENRRVQFRGS